MSDNDPLADLAVRASADPFFFGFALRLWQERHGLDDRGLARELGFNSEQGTGPLTNLRLCRMPRDRADCARIAERFGGDVAAIMVAAGMSS